MTVFAEVVGLLRLQTDKSSFTSATASIQSLGKSLQAVVGADVLARGARALTEFANSADDLGDQSEQLGIAASDLQAYGAVAAGLGIDQEKLTASFARVGQAAAEAAKGGDGAKKLFGSLGVSVTRADGTLKGLGELLPEVADGIKNTDNPTKRAALSMELFGRSAARMRLVMEKGSDGLQELRKNFEDLGGGISDDAIKQAGEFQNQVARMQVRLRAFGSTLLSDILPSVNRFADSLGSSLSDVKGLADGTGILGQALGVTAALGVGAAAAMALAEGRAKMLGKGALWIAALTLAFNELRAALSGADSALGQVVDKLGGKGALESFVKNYAAGVKAIREGASTGNFGVTEEELLPGIKRARLEEAARKAKLAADTADTAVFKGQITREEADALKARAKAAQAALDNRQGLVEQTAPRALGRGLGAPLDEIRQGALTRSTVEDVKDTPLSIFQTVNVNGTSGTPEEIKKATKDATTEALEKAASSMRTNVRRRAPVSP